MIGSSKVSAYKNQFAEWHAGAGSLDVLRKANVPSMTARLQHHDMAASSGGRTSTAWLVQRTSDFEITCSMSGRCLRHQTAVVGRRISCVRRAAGDSLQADHNYIGHNYISHNYIGHDYIGEPLGIPCRPELFC